MSTPDQTAPAADPKPTRVSFDLAEVLSPAELAKFQASAAEAGAETLTEHFLDLTLRIPSRPAA